MKARHLHSSPIEDETCDTILSNDEIFSADEIEKGHSGLHCFLTTDQTGWASSHNCHINREVLLQFLEISIEYRLSNDFFIKCHVLFFVSSFFNNMFVS